MTWICHLTMSKLLIQLIIILILFYYYSCTIKIIWVVKLPKRLLNPLMLHDLLDGWFAIKHSWFSNHLGDQYSNFYFYYSCKKDFNPEIYKICLWVLRRKTCVPILKTRTIVHLHILMGKKNLIDRAYTNLPFIILFTIRP